MVGRWLRAGGSGEYCKIFPHLRCLFDALIRKYEDLTVTNARRECRHSISTNTNTHITYEGHLPTSYKWLSEEKMHDTIARLRLRSLVRPAVAGCDNWHRRGQNNPRKISGRRGCRRQRASGSPIVIIVDASRVQTRKPRLSTASQCLRVSVCR